MVFLSIFLKKESKFKISLTRKTTACSLLTTSPAQKFYRVGVKHSNQSTISQVLFFFLKGKVNKKPSTKYATEKDKFVSRDSNPTANIRSIHPTQLPINFITEKKIPYNSSESSFRME